MENTHTPRHKRSSSRKEPLSGQERAAVLGTGILITFSFWSYGGRPEWAWIAFSILAFCVPICVMIPPWGKPREFIYKLSRSSIFWVGLVALIYPLIQALNPAYSSDYTPGLGAPVLEPLEHISWLPTSVQAPLRIGTPWKHILMFGGILSVFATLRVILTQRKSWITLLWVTLINCSLMAFLGTLVKLSGSDMMLWIFEPVHKDSSYFGLFTYKNNAAGVLYVTTTLGFTLYFYHARQAQIRSLRSGPHLLTLFLILFTTLPVYVTNSKSGMVITPLVCAFCIGLWFVHKVFELRESGDFKSFSLALIVVVIVVSGVSGTIGKQIVDVESVGETLTRLTNDIEALSESDADSATSSNQSRYIALIAFWEMLKDSPKLGVGAGCFEYFSREYSTQYPDIYYFRFIRAEGKWTTTHWRDAHSDWMEFLIEYGWIGFALILASLASWFPGSFKFIKHPRLYFITPWVGAGALIGHASFEFQFQTPSVVLVFMIAWTSPWFLQNLRRS